MENGLMSYRESTLERDFRIRLEDKGFMVLKLITPGRAGAMDRMILRPVYSPGEPMFVELKVNNQNPTTYQQAVAANWIKRGCVVLQPACGQKQVLDLADSLLKLVYSDYLAAKKIEEQRTCARIG
jgi:hypothetical protein